MSLEALPNTKEMEKQIISDKALFTATILQNPFIPHKPFQKQAYFLMLDEKEAFYGGAAGGGKSDALLMGALQYVQEPDYAALLLRRTYQDLAKRGALMDRAHHWLDHTEAEWNETKKRWTFPSGAVLEFGYIAKNRDLDNYDSAEYQFIGLDELTQFTQFQYTYMMSRLRRLAGSIVPTRIRGASNPGKVGHKWVKGRFVKGDKVFVPSLFTENRYIDQADYLESLNQLDRITRLQKRDGNWDVGLEGGLFNRMWFEAIRALQWNNILTVMRYWDLAATEEKINKRTGEADNDPDWTVGGLGIRYKDNTMVIANINRFRKSPLETDKEILKTAREDFALYGRYNYQIMIEQEGGASGKRDVSELIRKLAGFNAKPDKVSKDKTDRARPVSAYAEARNISYILNDRWNEPFLEELDEFPYNTAHDDQTDVLSGLYNNLFPIKPERAKIYI